MEREAQRREFADSRRCNGAIARFGALHISCCHAAR